MAGKEMSYDERAQMFAALVGRLVRAAAQRAQYNTNERGAKRWEDEERTAAQKLTRMFFGNDTETHALVRRELEY